MSTRFLIDVEGARFVYAIGVRSLCINERERQLGGELHTYYSRPLRMSHLLMYLPRRGEGGEGGGGEKEEEREEEGGGGGEGGGG